MALKFRRGTTAQQSGSLAFGEPYVNTTLGTLLIGGPNGDIVLSAGGTGSTGNFGAISGSGLDITGDANIHGNLTLGGNITIGDSTTDTVSINADLSSSIIPDVTNTFDLGSTSKVYRNVYATSISGAIAATNGVVSGSSQIIDILTSLNSFSGSQLTQNSNLATISGSLISSASTAKTTNDTQDGRLTSLESTSASVNTSVSNLNSFSGSQLTQNSNLATISGSLILTASNHEGRLGAIEAVSGTFARTNSANTFNGTQTVSGSLYVTQDLVVAGSSSIQNISSSNLVIGAAYVTLNANSPSSRYAGLNIIDSGSGGGSGSLWYDAVQDEFIQVHKGNGTNITSSHFVQGPQTYDNLGNETYLTNNRLTKGTGLEHIVDSQIIDDGTTVSIPGNLTITGSVNAPQWNALATITGSLILTASANTISVANLNTLTSSALTRFTNLESTTASLNISVSNLNAASSSYETKGRGIVSGSSQVTPLLPTGTISGSSQVVGSSITTNTVTLNGQSVALGGTATIANLVSGSSQITLSSTTGYGSVLNQAVLTSSSPTFAGLTINGAITATGDITAYYTSDKRHKNNIQIISNAVLKVKQLNGVTWEWNDDVHEVTKSTPKTGLIAQEVQAVLPQVVTERNDGFLALDYSKMMGLMVEAIKEQQIQIDNLTAKVEELKRQRGL